jgi:hypothetical protein
LNISAYDFPSIFTTIASVVGGSLRFPGFGFIFSAAYLSSFLLTGIIAVYVYFNVASSCCPLYSFSPLLAAAVDGGDHSPFCTTFLHNFKRGFECVIPFISNGWTFVLFVCLYILSDQLSAARRHAHRSTNIYQWHFYRSSLTFTSLEFGTIVLALM